MIEAGNTVFVRLQVGKRLEAMVEAPSMAGL